MLLWGKSKRNTTGKMPNGFSKFEITVDIRKTYIVEEGWQSAWFGLKPNGKKITICR